MSPERRDGEHREDLGLGGIGGDEVVVVAWPLLLRRRVTERVLGSDRLRWWVLWTVLAGLFSVNVTFTIFAVALPRLARELDTSENAITWVITGPLLAYGVVAPALGRLGDVWGHKRLYLVGMAGALISAVLSALAWNAGSLIAVRTLGAIEGAATGSAAMALIFRHFASDDRVKAMGWWSLVGAGGPVIGVALGGPLIEAVGWRWIFLAQVPLIALALVAAAVMLPETERSTGQRIDWAGAGTVTVGVTALLFALNRGPEWGWASPAVLTAFALFPIGLAAFAAVERRAADPLLPVEEMKQRNFAFPIGALAFSNFAYMGGFILAPSLLARVFGYGEARTGLLVIARPLSFSLMAPIAGYLAVRVGERSSAVVGCLLVVASMGTMAALSAGSSDLAIIFALALSGIGLGIASPSIASSIANAVDDDRLGVASAAQQLMGQVGVVAGIQVMKTVQAAREPVNGLVPSFGDAYIVGGAVALLAVACAAVLRSATREQAPTR